MSTSYSGLPMEALLESVVELAIRWDESQSDAKVANRFFDEIHSMCLVLRASEQGRSGIEALLSHPNRGVRMKLAGESLAWDSVRGVSTLQELLVPRGRYSFDAEMTLREYAAGRLRFDW